MSTLWLAGTLRKEGVEFELHSVDNHRGWHERVKAKVVDAGLSASVTLHLREFPPFWEKPGWSWDGPPACGEFAPSAGAEQEYVTLPETLGGNFDVILVDARFRRRCLETAHGCLGPMGIVALHDAQKAQYHEPLSGYKYGVMLSSGTYYPTDPGEWRMWFGSDQNHLVADLAG